MWRGAIQKNSSAAARSAAPPTRAVTLRACRGPHQKTSTAARRTSTSREIKPPREPESSSDAIGIRRTQPSTAAEGCFRSAGKALATESGINISISPA